MIPARADFAPGTRVPLGTAANQTLRWNGTAYVFAGLLDDGVNQSTAGNFTISGILTANDLTNTGTAVFQADTTLVVPLTIRQLSGSTQDLIQGKSSTNANVFRVMYNGETYVGSYLHSISGALFLASGSTVALTLSGTSTTAAGALTVAGNTALNGATTTAKTFTATTVSANGYFHAVRTVTAAYTITAADDVILVNGNVNGTLPSAVGIAGREYTIKLTSGTMTTVSSAGGSIDNAATLNISAVNSSRNFVSDGTNWYVFAGYL